MIAAPQQAPVDLILGFARVHGETHTRLLLHTAVPLGLTPEMLHLIRNRFVPEAPRMAEADILLSPVFEEIGRGMYEMSPDVRTLLLNEFKREPGLGYARLVEVAEYMAAYTWYAQARQQNTALADFLRLQHWVTLAYAQPEVAARFLAEALRDSARYANQPNVLRVASIADALTEPLLGEDGDVLAYAAALVQLDSGDAARAWSTMRRMGATNRVDPLAVAGVLLPAYDELIDAFGLVADEAEAASVEQVVNSDVALVSPEMEDAAESTEQPLIFISYSDEDWFDYVRPLIIRLREMGFNTWAQRYGMADKDWVDTISPALDRSAYMILCVSPDAMQSRYVKIEYRYFIDAQKPIFPVICRPTELPAELRTIQNTPYEQIDQLISYLERTIRRADARSDEAALESVSSADSDSTRWQNTIFIAYSRVDWNDYAEPLMRRLKAEGLDVWTDQTLLVAGQDWLDEINRALDNSKFMILCVSPDALASQYVRLEYRYFVYSNKPLFPVICRDTQRLPPELFSMQATDYADLHNLIDRIKKIIAADSGTEAVNTEQVADDDLSQSEADDDDLDWLLDNLEEDDFEDDNSPDWLQDLEDDESTEIDVQQSASSAAPDPAEIVRPRDRQAQRSRIFINYARVDKPYMLQVVDLLQVYDVWFDQRLYAGQYWWQEVLRRIDWAGTMINIISPESVESPYCTREYEIARNAGLSIINVQIQPDVTLPDAMQAHPLVDFSQGVTADNTKELFDLLHERERAQYEQGSEPEPAQQTTQAPTAFEGAGSKVFISYARVDKPLVTQIADTLDIHDVWYDQRLYAGSQWWKEILRRLEWAEILIFVMSPDSVNSTYCQRELAIANRRGIPILPILINADIKSQDMPLELERIQYIDMTNGLTVESVRNLLNAFYMWRFQSTQPRDLPADVELFDPSREENVVLQAARAMEKGNYDETVFLLRQARTRGITARFIDLDALLQEAEAALQRQTSQREAEREYRQIAALAAHEATRQPAAEAFAAFRQQYPNYDPDNLATFLALSAEEPVTSPLRHEGEGPGVRAEKRSPQPGPLPNMTWCEIPTGVVERDGQTVQVAAFDISQYPITNAQYRQFVDDPNGYANPAWWDFAPEAKSWREQHPQHRSSQFTGDEQPVQQIGWYDAMAFCNWLSARTGATITLPTAEQWIRAARGDDGRVYPWGDAFDTSRANTRETNLRMISPVNRYDVGASPYGVYDMAGNVWEWCLDSNIDPRAESTQASGTKYMVRGGSYISPAQRAAIDFHYYLDPQALHNTIGFRPVRLTNPD